MASAADKLVARMESAARVSADEARQIAEQMCADGIRSAPEAEALVEYNTRLDGHDADWSALFQRALRDYVLLRTVPEGSVSDDNLLWLRDTLAPEGHVRNTGELDFLILLQRQADSVPQDYDRFVLKAVCRQILREGSASAANTARVRKVLSASRRTGGEWISRDEARRLWKTNTELGKAANDPAWNALFARSIGNYLYVCTCPHPRAAGEALSREAWLDAADDVMPPPVSGASPEQPAEEGSGAVDAAVASGLLGFMPEDESSEEDEVDEAEFWRRYEEEQAQEEELEPQADASAKPELEPEPEPESRPESEPEPEPEPEDAHPNAGMSDDEALRVTLALSLQQPAPVAVPQPQPQPEPEPEPEP